MITYLFISFNELFVIKVIVMADNFTIMFLAVITKITMYLRAVATLSFIFEIIVAEQFCKYSFLHCNLILLFFIKKF